jgi:large subunit ribosomal protein L25
MAGAYTVSAEPRDPAKNKGTGTRAVRKLRAAGRVPAILYGHKQDNLPITLAREDVWTLIKRGQHVAQLKLGEQTEMALIRAVQWDHLGREILHLDFYRVSAHERVRTEVALVMHGTPIGLSEGGTLEQPSHQVTVLCEVTSIPDSIRVEVSHLRVNDAVHLRDLVLPEGVTTEGDPDMVLVHVVLKKAEAEPAAATPGAEGTPAQPEVIGRKEKKEGEEEAPAKK